MKRFCTFLVFTIVLVSFLAAPASDNFPQYQSTPKQPAVRGHTAEQENMFEAYVPPPPIRHSWPGGYRVLLHEVVNTFMDHVVGRY
jgi:hypothetical protein